MLQERLEEYIRLVSEIRTLAAGRMNETVGAEGYFGRLRADYEQIRALGVRCREILAETVDPVLASAAHPSPEILHALRIFCEQLLEPASGEELDILLLFTISDRLLKEYRYAGDIDGYVKQLDMHISVCYANVNRTSRLTVTREITAFYREEGLRAAQEICGYLFDRERFSALSREAQMSAVRGGRFYSALYDTWYAAPETNILRYRALTDAVRIGEDPFYREQLPNYDWDRYLVRCMEHMGQLTERGNRWDFDREQCGEICGWLERLEELWNSDPRKYGAIVPEEHLRLILLRNRYFAGRISGQTYGEELIALYEQFADDVYDMYAVQMNLLIPTEILALLRGSRLSARTEATIRGIYDRVFTYILRSDNGEAFNYLQEYLVGFLEVFIEIPGVMTFAEAGMQGLLALHPPTWIHSVQVAKLSRCLCGHLLRRAPERFAGVNGCADAEEVRAQGEQILLDVYRGALCHDFGKLCMIDTIFVYGRALRAGENRIIDTHPEMGAAMLTSHRTTARYADIACGHHRWYDGSDGYPAGFAAQTSPDRVLIDIVAVADALDAATDTVGRSYRQGASTPDGIMAEVMAEAGTRYAPYVAELLASDEVQQDVTFLLGEARELVYRDAWFSMEEMRKKSEG